MTEQLPVARYDLARDQFPFRMRILDCETRDVLWEHMVHGRGAVKIPGYAPRKVLAEITYANGHQFVDGPDGEHEERIVRVDF